MALLEKRIWVVQMLDELAAEQEVMRGILERKTLFDVALSEEQMSRKGRV